jgi:hypothetical protein
MVFEPRWIGCPDGAKGQAHVVQCFDEKYGYGSFCDRSLFTEPHGVSDPALGGLLVCPLCLARAVSMVIEEQPADVRPDRKEVGTRLLEQIGWHRGDPLPHIWRVNR